MSTVTTRKGEIIQDPPFVQRLLSDKRAGWLWLIPRVWLGIQWFEAGSHKVTDPEWVQTGVALKGFWERIVQVPESGRPLITFDFYRTFIQGMLDAQTYTWFGKIIAYGETLVGIALVLGAFTGIVAFFGAFMNFNFMLAGSASSNPVLFLIAIGLILAWKVAGFVGADYFLLRMLGTPWRGIPDAKPVEPAKAGT